MQGGYSIPANGQGGCTVTWGKGTLIPHIPPHMALIPPVPETRGLQLQEVFSSCPHKQDQRAALEGIRSRNTIWWAGGLPDFKKKKNKTCPACFILWAPSCQAGISWFLRSLKAKQLNLASVTADGVGSAAFPGRLVLQETLRASVLLLGKEAPWRTSNSSLLYIPHTHHEPSLFKLHPWFKQFKARTWSWMLALPWMTFLFLHSVTSAPAKVKPLFFYYSLANQWQYFWTFWLKTCHLPQRSNLSSG